MCTYTGDAKDPLHYNSTRLTDKAINEMTKTLLKESLDSCSKVGLNHFCALNPAPDVSLSGLYTSLHCSYNLQVPNLYCNFCRLEPPFGKGNMMKKPPRRPGLRPKP